MNYLRHFPLLAIILIAYNALMLTGNSVAANPDVIRIPLMANDEAMQLKLGDILVMLGIVLLYFEILKSTRTTQHSTLEHLLSMLVFIIFIVEFLVVVGAGTNVFLLLGVMSLIDVMGGYAISIAVARKDLNIS